MYHFMYHVRNSCEVITEVKLKTNCLLYFQVGASVDEKPGDRKAGYSKWCLNRFFGWHEQVPPLFFCSWHFGSYNYLLLFHGVLLHFVTNLATSSNKKRLSETHDTIYSMIPSIFCTYGLDDVDDDCKILDGTNKEIQTRTQQTQQTSRKYPRVNDCFSHRSLFTAHCSFNSFVPMITHLKFKIYPQKLSSEKESSLPTTIFEGLC